MPNSEYATIEVFLHKKKDKRILEHIQGLPRYIRQSFMREAFDHYIDHPVVVANEIASVPPTKSAPSGFKKYRDSEG